MTSHDNIRKLEDLVINTLKNIYDPEIPVNIYDLGLIYEIQIREKSNVKIIMTLTAPNCPVADSLPAKVREKVQAIKGISQAEIELTFEPPWDKSMISETGLLELGML